MVQGLANKILRVDLTNRTTTVEEPPENFYRKYLGGAGFIAYYLLKELPRGVDALSPDNIMVFADGPMTGTPVPGGARNCIGAKSPVSGGIAKSEVGGFWGHELKRAGYDAIIVKGKASSPVYIWIHEGAVEFKDATNLWGKDVLETQDAIEAELGERFVRTATIGQAGERLAFVSCIMTDIRNAAGRGGLGAVMGSKNLKSIAIKGKSVPKAADQVAFMEQSKWMNNNYMNVGGKGFHDLGTGSDIIEKNETGVLATRNWGDGYFENAAKINAQTIRDTYRVAMEACPACQVRCKKVVELENDTYKVNRRGGGPEYETLAGFGSFCGVDDLAAICKANELCSYYGLDTIATSGVIAFAMECFEKGLITLEDTDGLDLRFGNAQAMVKATELIGKREGALADLLADGSRIAARKIGHGAEEYAMQVKGVEFGMHEPRIKQGLGIAYAVNPHGADHMSSLHDTQITQEGAGMNKFRGLGVTDPLKATDIGPAKVSAIVLSQNWRIFGDSAVFCHFVPWTAHQHVELIRKLTGWDFTTVEAFRVGERVTTMMRAFNLREGLTAADDTLPKRFFSPTPRGPLKSTAIDRQAFEKAIHNYYRLMGWDSDSGIPTKEKLEDLGIAWVEEQISSLRKGPKTRKRAAA